MGSKKEQIAEIRAAILYFLYRNNYWQNRHTPKINIWNKLSQHPCKEINNGLKKLYKDKLIRYKKTNHGDDVYLNIHEKSKIEEEIKDKLEQLYNGNKHINWYLYTYWFGSAKWIIEFIIWLMIKIFFGWWLIFLNSLNYLFYDLKHFNGK